MTRLNCFLICALLGSLSLLSKPIYAQNLEFDQLYFNVGSHSVFLIDSDDTFIMFDGIQIIRSFDKGLTMDTVHDFTTFAGGFISPDNTLYMYHKDAIYKSTFCLRSKDKGTTWDTLHLGFMQRAIHFTSDSSMLVIPSGERKVYIYREDTLKDVFSIPAQLSNGEIFFTREDKLVGLGGGGPNTRLYSSDDLGKTWSSVPLSEEVSYLQCFEQITSNIYLLSSDSVLFYSSDTGKTWFKKWVFPSIVYSIKKTSSGDVYAFVGTWEYDRAVYRSFNGGNSWERESDILLSIRDQPFVEDRSGNIYFKTAYNGVLKKSPNSDELNRALPSRYSTTLLSRPGPGPNSILFSLEISKRGSVYAASGTPHLSSDTVANYWSVSPVTYFAEDKSAYQVEGVDLYYSSDYGKNFTLLNRPEEVEVIRAFCFPKKDHIFTINDVGSSHYSTNNGLTWKKSVSLVFYSEVFLKAISNKSGTILVLGPGYYRSSDQGKTWASVSVPISNRDNFNGYAAPWGDFYIISDTFMCRSVDDGKTWKRLGFHKFIHDVVFDDNGQIFVGTQEGEIYYSENKGLSFSILNTNLPNCMILRLGLDSAGFLYSFASVETIRNATSLNCGYLYRTKLPVNRFLDVENTSVSTDSIRLSVNPASDITKLLLPSKLDMPATLMVYDLEGHVKYMRNYQFIQSGENELPLDVSDLPNGVYTVLLRTSEKVMTTKLVVTR